MILIELILMRLVWLFVVILLLNEINFKLAKYLENSDATLLKSIVHTLLLIISKVIKFTYYITISLLAFFIVLNVINAGNIII